MAVFDASIAVSWLIDHPNSPNTERFLEDPVPIAPGILVAETTNTVWQYVMAGQIDQTIAFSAINALQRFFVEIVDDHLLANSALALAISSSHPVYDCLYLALALERNMPLITADKKLANTAQKLSIETELIRPSQ